MDRMNLAVIIYFSFILLIYILVGLTTNCFQDKVEAWKDTYNNLLDYYNKLNTTPSQKT